MDKKENDDDHEHRTASRSRQARYPRRLPLQSVHLQELRLLTTRPGPYLETGAAHAGALRAGIWNAAAERL
jgi:hypothetical protein